MYCSTSRHHNCSWMFRFSRPGGLHHAMDAMDEVVMDTMGGELHTRRLTLRRWRPANISALNLHAMGPCHGGLVAGELESALAVPLWSTLEVSIFLRSTWCCKSLLFLLCKHGKSATMILVLRHKRILQCCKYVCEMMATLGTFIRCTFLLLLLRTHTYLRFAANKWGSIAYTVSYCIHCFLLQHLCVQNLTSFFVTRHKFLEVHREVLQNYAASLIKLDTQGKIVKQADATPSTCPK
jgi:hypothetical protein